MTIIWILVGVFVGFQFGLAIGFMIMAAKVQKLTRQLDGQRAATEAVFRARGGK